MYIYPFHCILTPKLEEGQRASHKLLIAIQYLNHCPNSHQTKRDVKAEFHSKVELPLIRVPPVPHLAPFGGWVGNGYLFQTGTIPHFRETGPWRHLSEIRPPSSFLRCRTNQKVQRALRMCSREPAVKPKGFTAGFPYYKWRWQHPRANGNIGWGADIGGFQGS